MSRKMTINFDATIGNTISSKNVALINNVDSLYAIVFKHTYVINNYKPPKITSYVFKFFYADKYHTVPTHYYNFVKPFETIRVYFKHDRIHYVPSVFAHSLNSFKNISAKLKPVTMYNPVRDNNDFYTSIYDTKQDVNHAHNMIMGFFNSTEFKNSSWYMSSKRHKLLSKKDALTKQYKKQMHDINRKLSNL